MAKRVVRRRKASKVAQPPEAPKSRPEQKSDKEEEISRQEAIIQEYKQKARTPLQKVRAHCVECMGGYVREVSQCTSPGCALYPLRMGKNTESSRYGKPNPSAKGREKR